MSYSATDRFSCIATINPSTTEAEYLLRRIDKEDTTKTTDTFTLLPHEALILVDSLLELPAFQDLALGKLIQLNLARPNHS